MIDTKALVNDTLLRELSVETRKIGSRVQVKATAEHPGYLADIVDVIILPHSVFYRTRFMGYYKLYNQNSVKALKELHRHFPFIPDFELGIAYVLNVEPLNDLDPIKIKGEFEAFTTTTLSSQPVPGGNILK